MDFDFGELIERRGFDRHAARWVRHNRPTTAAYFGDHAEYMHRIAHPGGQRDPYLGADILFNFAPVAVAGDGQHGGLFVGAYRVLERWPRRSGRISTHFRPEHADLGDPGLAFELEPIMAMNDLVEHVSVVWGSGSAPRAWCQRADRQKKPILEIRTQRAAPRFPGFVEFACSLEDIPLIPESWKLALSSVRGIYVLLEPETGAQYVGSARGEHGFWGRWLDYMRDGHGGNALLKARAGTNFQFGILEVVSSSLSDSEIIHRESLWKHKLGTRVFGLNLN